MELRGEFGGEFGLYLSRIAYFFGSASRYVPFFLPSTIIVRQAEWFRKVSRRRLLSEMPQPYWREPGRISIRIKS